MLTPEDKQFLDDNRTHHETLVKAFYMRGLSAEVRGKMQELIGKYWQPGYHTDLWCPPCVSDMVLKLYRHYDEWIAQQPKIEPDCAIELMEELNKGFDDLLDKWPIKKDETTGTK